MRRNYKKDLDSIILKDNASLDEAALVFPLTAVHQISYTCSCGTDCVKRLSAILKTGAFCNPCVNENKSLRQGKFVYNKSNLIELLSNTNATLCKELELPINSKSLISFKCKCNTIVSKQYISINNYGAYCDNCMNQTVNDRKGWFVYNKNNLLDLIKKDKAILDESNTSEKLSSMSIIWFICVCGNEHNKEYRKLKESGAKCLECMANNGLIKRNEKKELIDDVNKFTYNKKNLFELLATSSATLINNIDNSISANSRIFYKCKCGTDTDKLYSSIRQTGAFCSKCVRSDEIANNHKQKIELNRATIKLENPGMAQCSHCKQILPESTFSFKVNSNERRVTCVNCVDKLYESIDSINDYIMMIKKEKGPCIKCGESNIDLLQFNHINRDGKKCGVTTCHTKELVDIEAAKCEMLCIICHYRVTKKQLNWGLNINNMQFYVETIKKKIGGCELCGWYDEDLLEALHFDHLDRKTKLASISSMVDSKNSKLYYKKDIDTEIAKCRLLCVHCHWLHTKKQMDHLDHKDVQKNIARKERKLLTNLMFIK